MSIDYESFKALQKLRKEIEENLVVEKINLLKSNNTLFINTVQRLQPTREMKVMFLLNGEQYNLLLDVDLIIKSTTSPQKALAEISKIIAEKLTLLFLEKI